MAARCVCCGGNVNIVARLTHHAGLPAEVSAEPMQTLISRYAWEKYGLALETVAIGGWDWDVDWDVCYRCYVFSGAERYFPFSMCPQFSY